jgi:DDE family transposase
LPFKLNYAGRHHIPRQKHKVTNWPAYDASLRQRGSLTVWFSDEAIAAWTAEPRTTRGGQPWYSALAILTALTLRAVFRLALRQTEGLIGSVIRLLGLDLPVPDHTTLSRRAATLDVPRPRSSNTEAGRDAEPVHLDGHAHLNSPALIRVRAQPVPDHALEPADRSGCVARMRGAGATTPTRSRVRRCGHSSGVPVPACG